MRKIVDYRVHTRTEAEYLEADVKRLIAQGWQPLGGAFVFERNTNYYVGQALVKYEAEPKTYGMSIGMVTPEQAATFNKDLERMADPVRYMGTVIPNPAPVPIPPTPSDAPGVSDLAGGE